jgi:hypothetical protein
MEFCSNGSSLFFLGHQKFGRKMTKTPFGVPQFIS